MVPRLTLIAILIYCSLPPTAIYSQNVGIGVTSPANKIDISNGLRTGVHPFGRPLYVTGNIGGLKSGIEFRHSNGSQGIGFGYNFIYAAGSALNQKLSFATKGEAPFSFITNNRAGLQIDRFGRIIIDANVAGPDSVKSSYPLQINNCFQGISISLPIYARSQNNYITFWDERFHTAKGCIEGQTLQDLLNSLDYIWSTITYTFDFLQAGAEGLACLPQQDWGEVISNGVAVVDATTKLAGYVIDAKANVGVSYQSGSADYAEYIEKKDPNETCSFGDIVGVSGGRVSKNTLGADHLMVISMAPGVLGNMPLAGTEKNFEKVAFMGQVPVKVSGPVTLGDYILASGKNDGIGYAVHPDLVQPNEYNKIVGIAWSASDGHGYIQLINVAVGLNYTKLSNKISRSTGQIDAMKKDISGIITYLQKHDNSFTINKPPAPIPNDKLTVSEDNSLLYKAVIKKRQEFVSLMKQHPEQLKFLLGSLQERLQKQGLSINKVPGLNKLLTDPDYFLKFYENRSKSF